MSFFNFFLEFLSAEVGKGYQEVHQHTYFNSISGFFYYFENWINNMTNCFRFFCQCFLSPFWVDHICQHSSCEVKAEYMNFGVETFLHQHEDPVYKFILPVDLHYTFLDWTFLKNSKAKTLSYTSIVLFFENLLRNTNTLMTLSRTDVSVPAAVKYSIPLRVETMTEIREVTACLKLLFLMFRMSIKKVKLSFWLILKISLRISS